MFNCNILSITNKISDSRLVCSARASLPLNVDLEMTFPIKDGVQTYKPKFELLSEEQDVQPLADQQAAAGIKTKQSKAPCSTLLGSQNASSGAYSFCSQSLPQRLAWITVALLCNSCFHVSHIWLYIM